MIKVVDSLYSKLPVMTGQVGASTTIAVGDLLYEDTTNGVVKPVTSSAGTTLNICGIAKEAVTTGAGETATVTYTPVDSAVFVEADCTSNTAANQLHKNHAMTDAATVKNTATTVATTLGIFHALAIVGEASDKKLYGYFIKIGQVTA